MTDLGNGLRELSRQAETPTPADPQELWAKGRNRVRRRRLAAVGAVAALAAVVGAGTLAVAPPAEVVPAGSPHADAVPRNVWAAHDWFAGTDRTGPPGVVAVLGGLGRDGGNGLFAVSAATGAYRLLDLPHLADLGGGAETAALAPDGRHIAYVLRGRSSGTPAPDEGADLPVGVAIYDTLDGSVKTFRPPTEHGISADGLTWLAPGTLMFTFGQRTSSSSSTGIRSYAWDLRDAAPSVVPGDPVLVDESMPNRSGGQLAPLDNRRFGPLLATGRTAAEPALTLPVLQGAGYQATARSTEYAVTRIHHDDGRDELHVGRIGAGGAVSRTAVVPGLDFARFVGWLAEDRALVLGTASGGDGYASLYEVDLRTLAHTRLGTAEGGMWSPGLRFATDLLAAPMVEGQHPPRVDPRWRLAGVAAGGVVLAWILVGLVRRRRRG